MAATNETLDALNELHGKQKPDDVGMGEWIWGALQGDFNAERSTGQIGFDMVVSLIPVVDTLCDVRDLCANIRQYRKDPSNKITLFFIATTVVGFIPELGTVVKSVLRLVWVYMKPLVKHADDITNASKLTAAANRACGNALPKITEYLQHNRIAKWATDGKLPDVYKFVGKTLVDASESFDPAKAGRLLNEKINDLKALLQKIRPIVPSTIREHLDELLLFLDGNRRAMSGAIMQFAQPVRTVLKVVAKKLDDHAWHVEIRRTNPAFVAPISEIGSARLINASPLKWMTKLARKMRYPALTLDDDQLKALMKNNPSHPKLEDWIVRTFAAAKGSMRAGVISGPAKLYRIIDPSNEAAGIFWISESEFKGIKDRDNWRKYFAVKPEWNQNGWYVEYEILAGETLPIWRGPASSQKLDGTNYYLEGGREQIVFVPDVRDEMVDALPRIDRETGLPIKNSGGEDDRRVEFVDITGQVTPAKVRKHIKHPRIKGPFETGWGATDYTAQEAKRILLTVPTSH